MRKLAFLSAAMMIKAFLFAAPVGNPASPQFLQEGYFFGCNNWFDVRLGYEGDFVGDARMNQYAQGNGRVDNFSQSTNSGTVTLSVLDRLDMYAVFGSSRVCTDWRFTAAELVKRIQLETSYHYLWAIGARGILFEWGNTILGLGGRYHASDLKPIWTTINGAPISTKGTQLKTQSWQIDLDLAYKIDLFIPYLGLKYSKSCTKIGTFSEAISSSGFGKMHMKNRNPVGILVGCSLTTGKYFFLNIEGRLIDEEAATIAGDFRF
ncbi:MAG: ompA-A [Parachlamydiales bacterium]|nr:ompA-A [Parachlamydiales bacterium]